MGKEYYIIKMAIFIMKVNLLMAKKKEMANICLKMAVIISDNG